MSWDEKYAIQVKVECAQVLDDTRVDFEKKELEYG